jgi:cytoskeleton protein RodZ
MSEMAMDAVATGATPGAQLLAARQVLGWTPEQVAEQLKWSPRQVLALEAGDYKALPGIATVRGFLRAYAKLLKLDPAPLVAQYDQQNGSAQDVIPVRRELATPFSEVRLPSMHRRGLSPASWALIGLLLLVVAGLGASHLGWIKPLPTDLFGRKAASAGHAASSDAAPVAASASAVSAASAAHSAGVATPPSIVLQATPTPVQQNVLQDTSHGGAVVLPGLALPAASAPGNTPIANVTAPPTVMNTAATNAGTSSTTNTTTSPATRATPTATTAPAGGTLVLKLKQDCWVEVKRVNGNVLLSRLLKAGETETVPMNEPVQLVVGNVAGIEATLRGEPLSLKNAAGNTARVILK